MVRSVMWIGFLIGTGSGGAGQNGASPQQAKITLTLPSNTPSEAVQIDYFMLGPFGAVGNFVRPEKGKSAYDISASVEGVLAEDVKIIAYMPGCEIVTLEIPGSQTTLPHSLVCRTLPKTLLRGVITPSSTIREHEHAEVEIDYLAMWDHRFFGIADGIVTSIRVASAVPDERGQFETLVPDLGSQTDLGEAVLQVTLRDVKTGNIIAFLKPTTDLGDSDDVRVRRNYPAIIEFRAKEL